MMDIEIAKTCLLNSDLNFFSFFLDVFCLTVKKCWVLCHLGFRISCTVSNVLGYIACWHITHAKVVQLSINGFFFRRYCFTIRRWTNRPLSRGYVVFYTRVQEKFFKTSPGVVNFSFIHSQETAVLSQFPKQLSLARKRRESSQNKTTYLLSYYF